MREMPSPRKKRIAIVATLLAIVALHFGWRAWEARRAVVAHVPESPDLARSSELLRDRIDAAVRRAQGWRTPAQGLVELSRLYHANGYLAEAQATYRGLLDVDAKNPRWPHLLATILAGYGQLEEAVPLFRRAVLLAPDYQPARRHLADALMKSNQAHESTAVLAGVSANQETRDAPADHRDVWVEELLEDCYDAYRLRVAAASATDGATAERWLRRAIHIAPDDAGPHRQLGELLMSRRDFPAARPLLQRAVELGPKEADNWAYLLRLLDLEGNGPAAEHALASGLANCPQSPSLHLERGRRLQRGGQLEAALEELETSRKLRPQDVDAYIEISTVYFRLNRVEDGIAILRRALAVEPAHPVALSALAFCAIGVGDEPLARRTLQEARTQTRMPASDMEQLTRRFGERFGRAPW